MKITALILAIMLTLSILAGCAKSTDGEMDDDTQASTSQETSPSKNTSADSGTEIQQYTDGVVFEVHISSVCACFYDSYNLGDELSEKDLFHFTAMFIFSQRPDTVTAMPDDSEKFGITAQQLEKTMKILFGDDVALSDYIKFMDEGKGDSFDSENGVYYFDKEEINSFFDNGYYLSYDDKMDVSDDDTTITAAVTVCNSENDKKDLTYTFEKIVDDSYMYVRLLKVSDTE